ncbi:hypothetical protein J4218_04005 [Candidatus Pacearchaeota archaeon]|nr:hypothetical protein [Candidatus Pacearchaeota archaeon]
MKTNIKLIILVFLILIGSMSFVNAVTICATGQNSSGSFNPNNGEVFDIGNSFNGIYNFVKSKASIGTCPLSGGGNAMFLAYAEWYTGQCSTSLSVSQLDPTVTKICNLAGYRDPYTWSSYFNADGGRCNYHSPDNDCLWYWNGNSFQYMDGEPEYIKRWITALKCINRLPQCNDGKDNDGDGKVDYPADLDCTSKNDDNEGVHCVVCASNADCNDNNNRTEDICINPGTAQSTCQHNYVRCASNTDCGTDGFTGNLFCQGNGIFQNYNSFICSNPGTNSSSCSNIVTPMLKSSCSQGQICSNAQCITTQCSNGIDDDIDGFIDSQDPGCWNNINDANTYNPLLNNESSAGITCFTNAQCGRDDYVENKYCQNGSVYQDYKSFTCLNPGLGGSSCSSITSPRLVQGCTKGCSSGTCLQFTCYSNSDCNDNDVYTVDECNNPGTSQSYCNNTRVNCVNDNDCGFTGFFGTEFCSSNDVFKNFKTSRCVNPGTKQSNCQVTTAPTFLIDCGDSSCGSFGTNYCKTDGNVYHQKTCNDKGCSNGTCFSTFRVDEQLVQTCSKGCSNGQCRPECASNADCNDNNSNTQDICLNPGTQQSVCQHNIVGCNADSDCGTSRFLNQLTCQNGNVFDSYIIFMCMNPGTGTSSCMNHTESRQVTNCTNGCQNGMCLEGQCTVDSDCHADYASSKYCISNSVYEDFHNYSCSTSHVCSENISKRLVETCDYRCRDGACRDKTSGSLIEEETSETSPLILVENDSDRMKIIESVYSDGLNETSLKLGKGYAVTSNNYNYLWLWLIGLIILLVIIIIVVIVILNQR